jgi:hypothetical protein
MLLQCWALDTIYLDISRYLPTKTAQIPTWCSAHISGIYLTISSQVSRYLDISSPNRQLCADLLIDKPTAMVDHASWYKWQVECPKLI